MTVGAPLVVASDIHLRSLDDERGTLLMDALARLGEGVEYLILNGDIFDFCYGGGAYFRRKFAPLGAALDRIAEHGTKVVFVEGNHEYFMERIGWQGVEIVTGDRYVATLSSGRRIAIGHGDLMIHEPLYLAFRAVVRSRLSDLGAGVVPGAWLDAYALKHAKLSRSRDKYRTLDHGKILAAFDRWLGTVGADHGVMGHFHVPYAERRPAADGLLVSVDSWDRPNLLVFDDDAFRRIFLTTPGAAFVRSPAESIFKSA